MESRTTSSPAGTPIEAAAASVNAIRPAAPARLIASKFIIVLQLPPVICAPSTGSLNFGSLEASWTRMSFQVAPSSSETICAMVEAMCWPMSALPQVTVTRPSGRSSTRRWARKLEGAAKRLIDAGDGGIAEHEAGGSGADQERAAAEIGGRAVGDFHVRIHVALRSVPALEAVRISDAARMIAF